jgi:hypothetical protein
MDVMRRVWTYKRKGIKGWWVGWYESGKRKAKALPTRKLAGHYRQIKYSQLQLKVTRICCDASCHHREWAF